MQSVLNRIDRFVRPKYHEELMQKAEAERQYKIHLANEIESWLNSDLGTYLNNRIETDKAKCLKLLATLDPENQIGLIQLQAKYQQLSTINNYIAQVLLEAKNIKN